MLYRIEALEKREEKLKTKFKGPTDSTRAKAQVRLNSTQLFPSDSFHPLLSTSSLISLFQTAKSLSSSSPPIPPFNILNFEQSTISTHPNPHPTLPAQNHATLNILSHTFTSTSIFRFYNFSKINLNIRPPKAVERPRT